MHAHQEFAAKDILDHIIDDMANAISQRPDEGPGHQDVRARVATAMMEDLRPSDVAQVMLAGHCVMFHAVLTDSFRDTLRGEMDTMRRGTCSNLVAMNNSFHMNLDRLDRYQTRDAKTANAPATAATIQAPSRAPETDAPPAARPAAVVMPVVSAPVGAGASTPGTAVAPAPVASAPVAPVASALDAEALLSRVAIGAAHQRQPQAAAPAAGPSSERSTNPHGGNTTTPTAAATQAGPRTISVALSK